MSAVRVTLSHIGREVDTKPGDLPLHKYSLKYNHGPADKASHPPRTDMADFNEYLPFLYTNQL